MAKSSRRGDVGLSASHSSGSKSRHWLDCLKRVCRKIGNKRKALSMRDTQRRLHPLPSRPGSNFPEKKGFPETSRRHQRRWRVQINFAARPANQVRDNRAVTEFTNRLENREIPMER